MKRFHKLLGAEGERHAEDHLRKKGLLFVARNVSLHRGEIDLIFLDGNTLAFVEVKTMTEESAREFGSPAEKITAQKRRHVTLAAAEFLRRHRNTFADVSVRFDVCEVLFSSREVRVSHLPNAFEAESGFHKKKLF